MSKQRIIYCSYHALIASLLALIAAAVLRGPSEPVWAYTLLAGGQTIMVGPYSIILHYSPTPPQVEQPLEVTLLAQQNMHLSGQLIAQPGPGIDAVKLRTDLQVDEHQPNELVGSIHLPVRGAWQLIIELDGPQGHGTASLPMTVSAPGAIPIWLGWLIGLSPLVGFGWLIRQQLRYRRKLLLERSSG